MSNTRKFAKLGTKASVALAGMFLTFSAGADQTTTFSGVLCVGSSASHLPNGVGTLYGYKNFTNGGGTVLCPLDRVGSDVSGDITGPLIRFQKSGSGTISCQARSCSGTMDSCDWGSAVSTTSTSATYLSMGSVEHRTNGFAYILCDLPSNSDVTSVFSYRATD